MKSLKTRVVFLVVATLAFGVSAIAQPGTAERRGRLLALTMKNFQYSLGSEYTGVVEGTIYDIVLYKKYHPELDYNAIVDRLNDLAVSGKSPQIRYKAHLASMYFSGTEQISVIPSQDPLDQDAIFRQIADQLEKSLLSSNLAGSLTPSR